jgi:hypothetical protein
MGWSAWSRHHTLMPVVPVRTRIPSPPERFLAADRFGMFPPLLAPDHTALDVELAAVGVGQLVADELGDVLVEQFRRVRVVGLCRWPAAEPVSGDRISTSLPVTHPAASCQTAYGGALSTFGDQRSPGQHCSGPAHRVSGRA